MMNGIVVATDLEACTGRQTERNRIQEGLRTHQRLQI